MSRRRYDAIERYVEFPADVSQLIEEAFGKKHASITIQLNGKTYKVNPKDKSMVEGQEQS